MLPNLDVRSFYDRFDRPVARLDCGKMCAPHNPSGKPFCCDICCAVPAVYRQEWDYLKRSTVLWREWIGNECSLDPRSGHAEAAVLRAETPANMLLLACQGPDRCQRPYRAISCRQFPFFPYIDARFRFIGLAYEWEFEPVCWVISSLGQVAEEYRREFVSAFDELFSLWPDEMDAYAIHSEDMRAAFLSKRRRVPILHRRGGFYLLSPVTERLASVPPDRLPRFGPYR